MTMLATVISVRRSNLLVIDISTRQRVQVNTREATRFRPGDVVRIRYNGIMTRSIPPQITANSIIRIPLPEN